jgi:hypothetical protein
MFLLRRESSSRKEDKKMTLAHDRAVALAARNEEIEQALCNPRACTSGLELASRIREGSPSFLTPESVGEMLLMDADLADLALVELLKRQTVDERANKGTTHKNKFGFSKKHVTEGTDAAIRFLNGMPHTLEQMAGRAKTETEVHLFGTCKLAYIYREQIYMFCLGAVPENVLDCHR